MAAAYADGFLFSTWLHFIDITIQTLLHDTIDIFSTIPFHTNESLNAFLRILLSGSVLSRNFKIKEGVFSSMKKYLILCFNILLILFIKSSNIYANNYYISNAGNDYNDGTTPQKAWKTVSKVNGYDFKPGDVVHFRKGDSWREQLIPKSGSEQGYITYTSYGLGSKPVFYGSIAKNQSSEWENQGNHIWSLKTQTDKISTYASKLTNSYLWTEGGAVASKKYSYESDMHTINITNPGTQFNYIQLIFLDLPIESGKTYSIKFKIKSSEAFQLGKIKLMQPHKPWTDYFSSISSYDASVDTDWKEKEIYFKANTTSDHGRITFFLGQTTKPGLSICIKNIQFVESAQEFIFNDIGNMIFNHGESCGKKKFSMDALKEQGDFYFDEKDSSLKIYSLHNPALFYKDIECAIKKNIINESSKSFVIYDGIELKYGSAHGIGGGNTHHIIVRNCDISYIGGGILYYQDNKPVRYGNGIEFWGNAHDNLVQNCNIYQIYDTGVTNQSNDNGTYQYNITYQNNTISDCEWSFEYWNRGETSRTSNIRFENNSCYNAGNSWSHAQRPDPFAAHVCFFNNTAQTDHIIISGNKFDTSNKNIIYIASVWQNISEIKLTNNEIKYNNNATLISGHPEFFTPDIKSNNHISTNN